jgi:hypothetical protein
MGCTLGLVDNRCRGLPTRRTRSLHVLPWRVALFYWRVWRGAERSRDDFSSLGYSSSVSKSGDGGI